MTHLLSDHREQLENLAHELLAHETLDAPAAYAAAGVSMSSEGAAPDDAWVAPGPTASAT